MAGIHGEWSENRKDLGLEKSIGDLPLRRREVAHFHQPDVVLGQLRNEQIVKAVSLLVHQLGDASGDRGENLAGRHAVGRDVVDVGGDLASQAGDANHVELVEVGGEDRQELDSFEQGVARVLGLVEDAAVELEPAQFAIDEQGWV